MLSAAEAEAFREHLPGCQACREAVRFEQQLREQVRAEQLDFVAPVLLIQRVKVQSARVNFRRRVFWGGGLCAAVLLAAGVFQFIGGPFSQPQGIVVGPFSLPPPELPPSEPAEQPMPEPPKTQVIDVARLEEGKAQVRMLPVAGEQQYLAVPQPTRDARVTFVMLYPAARQHHGPSTNNPPASP